MLRPKEVVNAFVDAFNAKDADALAALYSEDAVNHQVANEPVVGREAIRRMFRDEFASAKMETIVENIFEDGQWAILEWRDPLGLRGCGFFHVVNGKILFQRGYWDKLSFLKQQSLPIESFPRKTSKTPGRQAGRFSLNDRLQLALGCMRRITNRVPTISTMPMGRPSRPGAPALTRIPAMR